MRRKWVVMSRYRPIYVGGGRRCAGGEWREGTRRFWFRRSAHRHADRLRSKGTSIFFEYQVGRLA